MYWTVWPINWITNDDNGLDPCTAWALLHKAADWMVGCAFQHDVYTEIASVEAASWNLNFYDSTIFIIRYMTPPKNIYNIDF